MAAKVVIMVPAAAQAAAAQAGELLAPTVQPALMVLQALVPRQWAEQAATMPQALVAGREALRVEQALPVLMAVVVVVAAQTMEPEQMAVPAPIGTQATGRAVVVVVAAQRSALRVREAPEEIMAVAARGVLRQVAGSASPVLRAPKASSSSPISQSDLSRARA